MVLSHIDLLHNLNLIVHLFHYLYLLPLLLEHLMFFLFLCKYIPHLCMVNLYLVILDLNFLLKYLLLHYQILQYYCCISIFSKKFLILYLVFHHLLLLVYLTYFSHLPHYSISFLFFYKCKSKSILICFCIIYLLYCSCTVSGISSNCTSSPIYNTSSHHHF